MGTVPVVPVFPAGQLVTSAAMNLLGTAITWVLSGHPVTQLTASSTQSIPNNANTAFTWNSKIIDRDGGWAGGSPSKYTAQTPGIYKVAAFIPFAGNATGSRRLFFQVTTGSNNPAGAGLTTLFGVASVYAVGAGIASCVSSKSLTPYMYDGDFIQVYAYQSSGGALLTTITSDFGPPVFSIEMESA